MPTFLLTSPAPIWNPKNAAVEALVNSRQKTLALARDNLVKAREQHDYSPSTQTSSNSIQTP